MTNFEQVKEFNRAFGKRVPDAPQQVVDADIWELRKKLIKEEFAELMTAMETEPLKNVIKEATDLLVVTYGVFVDTGVDADAAMREVSRSNMSKLGADGKPIYREDGKILKGPNYSEADMRKVLDAMP